MSTIDQQFIEFIVKTLVVNPDKVVVEREIDERGVLLSLTVDPEDVGRVIGKRGATAQSLRTLLRVLGTKNGARYNLKIINTDDDDAVKTTQSAKDEVAKPADEPADEKPAVTESTTEDPEASGVPEAEDSLDEEESDLAAKTRAELADLDDLDI